MSCTLAEPPAGGRPSATRGRPGTMEAVRPTRPPRSAPPVSDVWLNIVMVVVFVLIGGFFSGTELALISLRESQVRALSEQGRRGAALARLLGRPQPLPGHGADRRHPGHALGVRLRRRDAEQAVRRPRWCGWGVSPGLAGPLAFISVTVGGQLPVAGARRADAQAAGPAAGRGAGDARRAARSTGWPRSSRPIVWVLSTSTNALVRLLGGRPEGRAARRSARRSCATWSPRTSR